jgi:hypothetical protein
MLITPRQRIVENEKRGAREKLHMREHRKMYEPGGDLSSISMDP